MFDSKRVRLATIVAVWVVLLSGFAWSRYERSSDDAAVRKDRAAVEAAAHTLRYDDVAAAWTSTKLGDTTALSRLQARIPVRSLAVHEDDGAIILVFESGGSRRVCIDLLARPAANTVRTRHC
jgi:hypothetical protein